MTTRSLSFTRSQNRLRLAIAEHPNLYFWTLFLLLNGLLFLPTYLFNRQTSTFLPFSTSTSAELPRLARQLLIWRNNLDIFRLSAEITLMMVAWVFLPWHKWPRWQRLFRWLFGFVYLLALAYAIYENGVFYLYQEEAILYAHALMLIDGLEFLLRHLPVQIWLIPAAALFIAAGITLLLVVIQAITSGIPRNRLAGWSKGLLAFLTVYSLIALAQYGEILSSPKSVVSSLAFKLSRNATASIALYRQVHEFDNLAYNRFYDYSGYDLLEKPDIYLIFIESYGSNLYKEPLYTEKYTNLLSELEGQLQEKGWQAASTLTESPSWGGGSWMAYTTVLFGMRIDNHPHYVALLERFQDEAYPDLGYTLQEQGYEYVRATSLAAELSDDEWQKYVNFFGVNRWIRYRDLEYEGMHYGWGPSPPDQYVLNALHEELNGDEESPFLLFWITQNSHYPWREVPQVVDDWRAMNDGSAVVTVFDEDQTSLATKKENYFQAITYELSFLTDFILNEADDNALIVLIGDHQPGYITRRSDGFATPLHIVSKDHAFLEQFTAYGFEKGLQVHNPTPALRHEGFYSLFMRSLLEEYGLGHSKPPHYLPDGITISQPEARN